MQPESIMRPHYASQRVYRNNDRELSDGVAQPRFGSLGSTAIDARVVASQRERFAIFISELVILEISAGDATAAAERLIAVRKLDVLKVNESATEVGDALLAGGAVPLIASRDALHVGICAANGIEYLLTWNFRHLANAVLRDKIDQICRAHGYVPPIICTPEELFEE